MKNASMPDEESGRRVGQEMLKVVENQLRDGEPPETRQTYERLIAEGYDEDEAKRYIGSVLAAEIYWMMKDKRAFDRAKYVLDLERLPQLPDES